MRRAAFVAAATLLAAFATDRFSSGDLDETLRARPTLESADASASPDGAELDERPPAGPATDEGGPEATVDGADTGSGDRSPRAALDDPRVTNDGSGDGPPRHADDHRPPSLGDRALGDRALGDRALGDRALGDRALGDRALGDRVDPEGPSADPSEPGARVAPGSADTPTVLRLVYFVEADRDLDPAAVVAIEEQAEALQVFWYEQFGGTFRLPVGGVDVVYGDHPAAWYDRVPAGADERWNRLANIRAEVIRKLDIPDEDGSVRVLTYPDARIDGRVGANRYEGAWMDGDDISCVNGIVETTPYTADYPAGCLATVAHELGHVYGLGHQGPDDDCMQFGFYRYVNGAQLCDFGEENRASVLADPRNVGWLDAEPGDRG